MTRRGLQVGTWDGSTFSWFKLDEGQPEERPTKLNIDDAVHAAERLYQVVRAAAEPFTPPPDSSP